VFKVDEENRAARFSHKVENSSKTCLITGMKNAKNSTIPDAKENIGTLLE
jgi:hypothetical protein